MDAVLRGALPEPVTIRVAGRVVLRAVPSRREGDLVLVQADGVAVSAAAPVAVLLDREDLIAALQPGGAEVEVFLAGNATHFLLRLRRLPGGLELVLEGLDGRYFDAHDTSIRAILPQADR